MGQDLYIYRERERLCFSLLMQGPDIFYFVIHWHSYIYDLTDFFLCLQNVFYKSFKITLGVPLRGNNIAIFIFYNFSTQKKKESMIFLYQRIYLVLLSLVYKPPTAYSSRSS